MSKISDFMEKIRKIDGTTLKIIALLSMVIDHVGDIFFPNVIAFRAIGRIAMPVFAFMVAEGYIHTSDKKKYLLRLAAFALISEIPFDLALVGRIGLDHQNIMFSFLIAILALMLYDKICTPDEFTRKVESPNIFIGTLSVLLIGAASFFLRTDYHFFAVVTVFIFYFFKDREHWLRCLSGIAFLLITRSLGYYVYVFLALIPLLMYDGKRGKGLKYLFYAFYPGHLLLIYLLKGFR